MQRLKEHNVNVRMVIAQFRPFIGGAELQAELLAKTLSKKNIDVEVFTQRLRGVPSRLSDDPVTVHRLWVPGYRWVKVSLFIRAFYRALISCHPNVDIIHAHQAGYPAFAAVLAAQRLGVPVIVKCTNSGPRFDLDILAQTLPFGRNMARYIAQHTTQFIALNEQATEQLAEWEVERARVVQIPNGVLVSDSAACVDKASLRASLNLPQQTHIIIGIGSLTDKKKFSTLLHALAKCRQNSSFALQLIGDGPLASDLKAQAEGLRIASHVAFLGRVTPSHVHAHLTAADSFVLPSVTEGISNALLEAMAVGLPCIVSDIPGNRMLVDDRDTGILFRVEDVDSLAEALNLVMSDSHLREHLGKEARRKVCSKFDIKLVTDKYIALYEQLTN